MKLFTVFAVLLAILSVSISRKSPGIEIKVKRPGIHYASTLGLSLFETHLRTIEVPDVLSDHSNKDFIRYGLTDIRIDSLFLQNPNNISLSAFDDSGLNLQVSDLYMTLHGNYFVRIGTSTLSTTKRGRLNLNLSKISMSTRFNLGMSVGADGKGRISVGASQCSATDGSIEFQFHGDLLDEIIDKLQGSFDWAVKHLIGSVMCQQLTYFVDHNVDTLLLKMPVDVKVPGLNGVYFDTSLSQAPSVTHDSVTFGLVARGSVPTLQGEQDYETERLNFDDSDRMLEALVSSSSINSVLEAWYNTGAIDEIVTQTMVKRLSPANAHYLNISCTDYMCLGSLLPTVDKKFGGASLWVDTKAARAPVVSFQKDMNTVELDIAINLDMRALYPNEALIPIFNTDVYFNLTLTNVSLSSVGSNLHLRAAAIDTTQPKVKLNSVNVDGVKESDVAIVFQFAIPYAMDPAQKPVRNGISIPVPLPFSLENMTLSVFDGSAQVSTDATV